MAGTSRACRCDAFDPTATSAGQFCCDAQPDPLVGLVLDGQFRMRRRNFIALLGGAAAWPLAARAQQPGKMPRIGFLALTSPSTFASRLEAIRLGLRDFGYVEDVNIIIEFVLETKAELRRNSQTGPNDQSGPRAIHGEASAIASH